MIKVVTGNLLDSDAQTLVNTVNCVGVMGKGIALEFKKRFPAMFEDYAVRCARGEVRLGHPYLFRQLVGPWILNFPTKDHWRSLAKLDDITRGLEYLDAHYKEWGITSLAVPPLGCGNGQLEWRVVGPTLYRHLQRLDIPVELYAPLGTPSSELEESFLRGDEGQERQPERVPDLNWINSGGLALVEIVKRLTDQPYHWPIGRIIFQKIAYVATQLGIPTQLRFGRGSHGPYAQELKRLESRLVNNGLLNESPVGRRLQITVGPTYEDIRREYGVELAQWDKAIDRTVDLFMRIRSANQAELVATVMFATKELEQTVSKPSETDILEAVMDWKSRRRPPLDQSEVAETIRGLAAQGWIQVESSPNLPVYEALPIA